MEQKKIILTSSHNKRNILFTGSTFTRLSLLIGLGLILFVFETLVPRPLPWLKPGFAHVATLVALYIYGNRAALIVVIIRIFLGSIIIGTLLNPTFVLSFFGGVISTLVMIIFKKYFSTIFSIFGISIIGAVVHNLIQLLLVEMIIVQKIEIFYLAPVMIFSAIFTGFVVALVSHLIISKIETLANQNEY